MPKMTKEEKLQKLSKMITMMEYKIRRYQNQEEMGVRHSKLLQRFHEIDQQKLDYLNRQFLCLVSSK